MDMSFKFGLRAGMAALLAAALWRFGAAAAPPPVSILDFFQLSSFDFDAFRTYPGFCPICSTE